MLRRLCRSAQTAERRLVTIETAGVREQSSLAFEEIQASPKSGIRNGEPLQAAIVHGLLGQGRNWRTWARRLAKEAAEATQRPWSVLLIDQRCHGATTSVEGFKPPHTLGASATDIAQLFRRTYGKGPDLFIGHSLGGKVALEYLHKEGTGLPLPKQVWVLDSNPGVLPKDTSDVAKVMDAISDIKVPLPSRDMATAQLEELGFSEGLRLWLGSNLVSAPGGGGLTWTFDLDGARQLYEDYKATQYWHLLGNVPPGVTLHLVRAANSDRRAGSINGGTAFPHSPRTCNRPERAAGSAAGPRRQLRQIGQSTVWQAGNRSLRLFLEAVCVHCCHQPHCWTASSSSACSPGRRGADHALPQSETRPGCRTCWRSRARHSAAGSPPNAHRWTMDLEEKLAVAAKAAQQGAGSESKGRLELQTLQNAGHWLHVDNPNGLLDMVLQGCKQAAKP